MGEESSKEQIRWGYVLDAPGRPPVKRQRECIGFHGLDVTDPHGPVWADKLDAKTTRPRSKLVEREALLEAMGAGDVLVVGAPECLGVGAKDVEWFLGELAARGVSLIVNGGSQRLAPGADPAPLIEAAGRAQKAQHMRAYRRKD